jgi:hypothetical protein
MGVPTAIGPPPAMTITTNRRVNDFGAWYDMSGPSYSLHADGAVHQRRKDSIQGVVVGSDSREVRRLRRGRATALFSAYRRREQ